MNLPQDADDLSKHAPALFELKGKQEGFVVPQNYFAELTDRVVSMTVIPKDGGLVVPENYFEELPEYISAVVNLPSESGLTEPTDYFEELPGLIEAKTSLPSHDGLVVPENYFEDLSSQLESQISLENVLPKTEAEIPADYFIRMESELHVHIALDNVKQDEGFVVPDNYFENLTQRILAETDVVALEGTRSDNDSALEDPNVPAGYFDELPGKVIARLEDEGEITEERGRVIVFAEWTKKYWRPASVAASAALLIGLSWFFLSNSENNSGSVIAFNPTGIVPDRIIHSVAPVENTIRREATPEGIANAIPNKSEEIKLNPIPAVIMNEDEIIAQSDLMDESMVMDFVAESEAVEPTEEVMDESMMEYLMNDNAGLDVFDPGDK